MKQITVAASKTYDILIGKGLLDEAGERIRRHTDASRAVIVSDSNVFPLYGDRLLVSLRQSGMKADAYTFPAGEASKQMTEILGMLDFFAKKGLTRPDIVIALGGGVTGDMAGFAASIYLRGVRFVQIPTTLLAQIDSSVGGKTGVDLPCGKNLAGSFWQPSLVLVDPDTLATLPPEIFADGMAEGIKYGCIRDDELFHRLMQEDVQSFLEDFIFTCVDIKRRVVESDEHEAGERMLLNFGHSMGHSIERYFHFTGVTHGEAVGIGMAAATAASEAHGLTSPGTAEQIRAALQKYRLPNRLPAPLQEIVDGISFDKKRHGSQMNLILLRRIGDSFVYPIPYGELRSFFAPLAGKEEL